MIALALRTPLGPPRAAVWFAFAFALAALVLPDCCLNGRHVFGAGMEAFGPICRAAS